MIIEQGVLTATNTDLLSSGRLNALPYNGTLTLQFQADKLDDTNNWTLTLQKPNGDVPIDAQKINAGAASSGGVLNSREMLETKFAATQGGHFTVNCTLTGSANLAYRIVLTP